MRINIFRADPCRICSENQVSFSRTQICIKQRCRNIHNNMELTDLTVEQRQSILNELFMKHQRSSGNLSNFVAERLLEGNFGECSQRTAPCHSLHEVPNLFTEQTYQVGSIMGGAINFLKGREALQKDLAWLLSVPPHAWFSAPCV